MEDNTVHGQDAATVWNSCVKTSDGEQYESYCVCLWAKNQRMIDEKTHNYPRMSVFGSLWLHV